MCKEWIEVRLGSCGDADCTLTIQDSLRTEIRQYLIEGDGWRAINRVLKRWNGMVWQVPFPSRAYEGTVDYTLLRGVYLVAEDYEVV